MMIRNKLYFLVFLVCLGCSGSGIESVPVELPIPFSGNLTADTNIFVAEGNPVSSNTSLNSALKNQAEEGGIPISWELFESSGVQSGNLTFNSLRDLVTTPFPTGGDRREYFMDICATRTVGERLEVCSSNFHCFDFPVEYTPADAVVQAAAEIPGATAGVRKLMCSGNSDRGEGDFIQGELVDGKMLIGTIELPDGSFRFHTQQESGIYIHGTPFLLSAGEPSGNVVMTLFAQGVSFDVAPPPGVVISRILPLFSPGSEEVVGTKIMNFTGAVVDPSGLLADFSASVDFYLGSSFVRVNNVHFILHAIPELNSVFDQLIEREFLDDPNFTDAIFSENGAVVNYPTVTGADPVNCDPEAAEVSGIFRELCCEGEGTCHFDFRCLLTHNIEASVIAATQSIWIFTKQ